MIRLAINKVLAIPLIKNSGWIIAILLICAFYWAGLSTVPFHPDESTQLYNSADFEQFFKDPLSLVWQPGSEGDPRMLYRLLDAPLTRYVIGFTRVLGNIPPLKVDWDWAKTWVENEHSGALPSDAQLVTGRFAQAFFFFFDLILAFQIGKRCGKTSLGWLFMLLIASNALVLLHTRRAMAESVTLFTVLLSLWTFIRVKRRLWLIAIPVALAFSAKQSTLPLAIIGLVFIIFQWVRQKHPTQVALSHISIYLALFIGITLLLNPFLWAHPIQAAEQAVLARQELLGRQVGEIGAQADAQVLSSLLPRTVAIVANLFITSPAIADVGNYLANTQSSSSIYFSSPFHNLFRGFLGGGILLIITLFGAIVSTIPFTGANKRNNLLLLILISGFIQFLFLILTVPLPFQRYVVPLIPYVCLTCAVGVDWIFQSVISVFANGNKKSRE